MVFYFSGTGNSLYAAKCIARAHGEELISMSAAVNSGEGPYAYALRADEILGFVFPVHAWGPPQIVLDFIGKLELNNYKDNYTFAVITCGDKVGNAVEVVDSALQQKNMRLHSGFSVKMPNNYMIVGDVDSKEVAQEKLSAAEGTLEEINATIGQRGVGVFRVTKGALPWLLTGFINPLFNKNAINARKFSADDACTGCGICERICSCCNIEVDGKPRWGTRCTQCMACINYCPERAIQYGKGTVKKGRYINPNIPIDEMV